MHIREAENNGVDNTVWSHQDVRETKRRRLEERAILINGCPQPQPNSGWSEPPRDS